MNMCQHTYSNNGDESILEGKQVICYRSFAIGI